MKQTSDHLLPLKQEFVFFKNNSGLKTMRTSALLALFIALSGTVFSQTRDFTQIIRGRVTELQSSHNDAVNDIVIRGNSPDGMAWHPEGIPIPNPNHFGMQVGTGVPVNMLNNNVLSNSDFLTGAFPAEYGNATFGVFDL